MSAQSIAVLTLTFAASAQITAERFIGFDGAMATAAGAAAGVARTDAAPGDDFPADVIGTTVVEAAGAIAVGGEIEVGDAGRAAALDAGVTVARALQEATADGDRIEVLLIGN